MARLIDQMVGVKRKTTKMVRKVSEVNRRGKSVTCGINAGFNQVGRLKRPLSGKWRN